MKVHDCIETLPWHPTRRWSTRELRAITRIVIHQQLGNGSVEATNRYHITPGPENHLSAAGAPHLAYHYGIERPAGGIIQANRLSDITWHTRGQNVASIGIMLCGHYPGTGHELVGLEVGPTDDQMTALAWLVDHLRAELNLPQHAVHGHYHFGRPACPGHRAQQWIEEYRNADADDDAPEYDLKTVRGVQQALTDLGYDLGRVDGDWGLRTAAAVRRFQADVGLSPDGIVGPETRSAFRERLREAALPSPRPLG